MYVYFFIKCVVGCSENSVRLDGFQMGQILSHSVRYSMHVSAKNYSIKKSQSEFYIHFYFHGNLNIRTIIDMPS